MKSLTNLDIFVFGEEVEISKEAAISLTAAIMENPAILHFRNKIKSNKFPPEDTAVAFYEIKKELDNRIM